MKNIITLVKYDILGLLNKLTRNKFKLTVMLLLMLSIIAFYVYYFLSFSILSFENLKGTGFEHFILYTPLLMLCNFIVLYIITNSVLSTEKDTEMLLSFPMKKSSIIISKAILSLGVLFGLGCIIFIPTVIYYAVCMQTSITVILNAFIVLFLCSLFFLGFGYLFNSFINFFVIRLRLYKLFRLVIVLGAVSSFLYFYINIPINGETYRIFAISNLIDFVVDNDIVVLLSLIVATCVFFVSGVIIFSNLYGRKAKSFKTKKKELGVRSVSSLHSLIRKEFICYFNSSVYLFNTIVGYIFIFGGAIYLHFIDTVDLSLIYLLLCCALGLCCTSNSSISLEGKNIWIIKAAPVKTSLILFSKVLMNFIMLTGILTISFVILVFTFNYTFSAILLLYTLGILSAVFISIGGILINLLLPKLDFKSEMSVVKQSAAAISSIFFFLIFLSLPSMLYLMEIISIEITTLIFINCIYLFVLDLVLLLIILLYGTKLFDKL